MKPLQLPRSRLRELRPYLPRKDNHKHLADVTWWARQQTKLQLSSEPDGISRPHELPVFAHVSAVSTLDANKFAEWQSAVLRRAFFSLDNLRGAVQGG